MSLCKSNLRGELLRLVMVTMGVANTHWMLSRSKACHFIILVTAYLVFTKINMWSGDY